MSKGEKQKNVEMTRMCSFHSKETPLKRRSALNKYQARKQIVLNYLPGQWKIEKVWQQTFDEAMKKDTFNINKHKLFREQWGAHQSFQRHTHSYHIMAETFMSLSVTPL